MTKKYENKFTKNMCGSKFYSLQSLSISLCYTCIMVKNCIACIKPADLAVALSLYSGFYFKCNTIQLLFTMNPKSERRGLSGKL